MPRIIEAIIITRSAIGMPHIAPLGLIEAADGWIIAPFFPSTTLQNLREFPHAVANYTDDTRVFAGCLTGRRDWPLLPTAIGVPRLANCQTHAELRVVKVEEHIERPKFFCQIVAQHQHSPFQGFNRAKAALIELAILTSRLSMLAPEKVHAEIEYLEIALRKTAGPEEYEAWGWLMEQVNAFYKQSKK